MPTSLAALVGMPIDELCRKLAPGAVVTDPEAVIERAVRMVTEREVVTIDGGRWLAGAGEFNQFAMMDPAQIKPLVAAMRSAK